MAAQVCLAEKEKKNIWSLENHWNGKKTYTALSRNLALAVATLF